MHNEILKKYIDDPNILYIYEIGLQIYGLFPDVVDRDFILVCQNGYVPKDFNESVSNESGIYNFKIFSIEQWFNLVLNNELIAWECACLNKKFIHKEHVKLMLTTNPLQLRKIYEFNINASIEKAIRFINDKNTLSGQKLLWTIVKNVMFSNQIIENHKIINFKEPADSYRQIVNGQISDLSTIIDTFKSEMYPHLERFKKYTDEMLAKSKLKSIKQDI